MGAPRTILSKEAAEWEPLRVGHHTATDGEPVTGRYTLERTIGAGAAAVVYEGRDLAFDRAVAVKVYRQGASSFPRIQHSREIAALAKLRHANLVTLYDGGTETGPDGRTYLVTDFVDGPTLAERLSAGPLDVHVVRDLAAGLAGALAHVHAHGFIHRDVKPANILLDGGRVPRLVDFGIAKALDSTVATATGVVAGTAAYLAPEQVRGELVGPATDVYALGLVLLEALTGQREYPGTAVESSTARLHRRAVVPAGLPWDLTGLLEAMTDPDPSARPTAAAVAVALDPATAPKPGPTRNRVLALIAVALLLGCLAGGAALFMATSGPTTGPADPSPAPASPAPAVPAAATLKPPPADDVVIAPERHSG